MNTEELPIRYSWNNETKQWNYSIVDTIDFVIQTSDARNYWKVLKNRLKKRGNKIPYNCNQLKMRSRDGKSYLTDVTDATHILEIVSLISDLPSIDLEVWIRSIEDRKHNKATRYKSSKGNSFPQKNVVHKNKSLFGVICNRLKQVFHF